MHEGASSTRARSAKVESGFAFDRAPNNEFAISKKGYPVLRSARMISAVLASSFRLA
jgi:hypothetical protein